MNMGPKSFWIVEPWRWGLSPSVLLNPEDGTEFLMDCWNPFGFLNHEYETEIILDCFQSKIISVSYLYCWTLKMGLSPSVLLNPEDGTEILMDCWNPFGFLNHEYETEIILDFFKSKMISVSYLDCWTLKMGPKSCIVELWRWDRNPYGLLKSFWIVEPWRWGLSPFGLLNHENGTEIILDCWTLKMGPKSFWIVEPWKLDQWVVPKRR